MEHDKIRIKAYDPKVFLTHGTFFIPFLALLA